MDSIRIVGWTFFIAYLAALCYFMFFADLWGRTQISAEYSYNLVPFREIRRYLMYWDRIGIAHVLLNLGGNVIGFMPLGFCIPLLYRYHRSIPVILICSFLFSAGIELIQLLTRVGSCDIDDVILNTAGGLIGYILFIFLRDRRRERIAVRKKENTDEG